MRALGCLTFESGNFRKVRDKHSAVVPAFREGDDQSMRAEPSKSRRPLFRKRLDAFLDLGAAHAVAGASIARSFVKLAAGKFVDGGLHAAHRPRRVAGEKAREPVAFFIEGFGGYASGEITDPQHL